MIFKFLTHKMKAAVVALALIAASFSLPGVSKAGPLYVAAVHGYDVVAYFTQNKPVRGDTNITHYWNGALWLFSSAEHRKLFIANPTKYAPQYDGYCAFAAARGLKAPTDPTVFKVYKDKLYLNLNKNVGERWAKNIDSEIKNANANWRNINPF